MFLAAAAAAKDRRANRPALLLVPTMVPEGAEGQNRLDEFVPRFEDCYLQHIRAISPDAVEADDELERPIIPILREGIEYQRGIALTGRLDDIYLQRARTHYSPLSERIEALAGLMKRGSNSTASSVQSIAAERILTELQLPEGFAFAEYVDIRFPA